MMFLTSTWFVLIFVLLAGYAILDGFDLGVGIWHMLGKDDQSKRQHFSAIGPVWDGNEVWLLTGGGALFAAFPPVYATFSESFYLAIMLLLAALIFRAVSLEFRSKVESSAWQNIFDVLFSLGSLLAALLLGVALGNVIRGLPINAEMQYTGGFFNLLNPFALLVGITGVVLLAMHGAAYMAIKTEGDLQQCMRRRVGACWYVFVAMFVVLNIVTAFEAPHLFENIMARPLAYLFAVIILAAVVYTPMANRAGKDGSVFLATSAIIAASFGLVAAGMFPAFIPSITEGGVSLTAHTHSSTKLTLTWMLGIAGLGVPLVLIYTAVVYWTFRGKVKLTDGDY